MPASMLEVLSILETFPQTATSWSSWSSRILSLCFPATWTAGSIRKAYCCCCRCVVAKIEMWKAVVGSLVQAEKLELLSVACLLVDCWAVALVVLPAGRALAAQVATPIQLMLAVRVAL